MKKNISVLTVLALVASTIFISCGGSGSETATTDSTATTAGEAMTLNVDPASSSVNWMGEMLGVYSHSGTVKLSSGEVMLAGTNVTGGKFTVDMKSINPTDSNYNAAEGHTADKLVGHLATGDFFAVDSIPTASFEITKVEGNVATGNLTVRGKTNEEQVKDITVTQEGDAYKVSGNLTFDRQKYGVAYKAAKDMVLSDNIALKIDLMARK
ncbi:MAG: YceI family protein [Bacteroidetes bacterium]|nr:YceI family protein [Bacteroidota bacterium]